jgi:Kdo2-lipid IVA lauroyltransferase/acyltransferase
MTLPGRLRRRFLHALGAIGAWLAWALRIRRRVVLDNLRLAFPEKSEAERHAIARATYRHLGQLVPEFFLVQRMSRAEIEALLVQERPEILHDAMARGKGLIACTAHFGNFEVLAATYSILGVPVTMITRPMGKSRVNDLWRRTRRRAGIEDLVVRRGGDTLAAAVRSMKAGRALGYVIDQNMSRRRAVFPTFFGVPAATAPTPAVLAMRTGAPVIFVVAIRQPDGRHRVVFEGPLEVPRTGDRERDVLAFLQDLNDRLERWVRLHPEQWYWLHRRWKTRPGSAD